jgi:anthranilate synthase component I
MNAEHAPLHRSTPDDASRHRLAWATFAADLATPVRLFLALRAQGRRVCLLESAPGEARLARYSFLGVDPSASFRGKGRHHRLSVRGEERVIEGSLIDALRQALALAPAPHPPRELPPFCGGWVGFFAYEWSSELEPRVPRAKLDPWNIPDATLDRYDDVLALDHAAQKLYVMAAAPGGAADFDAAQARIDAIARDAFAVHENSGDLVLEGEPEGRTEPAEYRASVDAMRAAIAQGEIFQGVPSQRFEQRFTGDVFTLYRVLRLANPSPHMFFFEADGLTLVGSSPERLVAVRDGKVENRPIAGTRPRGATPDEDERLAEELLGSAKECAEHDMLVDLARNDLGRVARIGTVRVREHRALERFARVQHLVSRVECDLAAGKDALDALVASFPAGTVTGAPKVRAQELIASLERDTRGPYSGAFGYLDGAGNLDVALIIRSFAVRDGVVSVQAGAGVVFDSDAEAERLETLNKAQALFEAARLTGTPAFRGGASGAKGDAR